MAPHSSTLAWKIPWVEEPGRLQSMGSLRVRNDWATSLSLFTFMHWKRKWQPTPVFLPGASQGREIWWAAVYGVAQSQTRLKWLSSSSSRSYFILELPMTGKTMAAKEFTEQGFTLHHKKQWSSWVAQICKEQVTEISDYSVRVMSECVCTLVGKG